MCIRDSSCLGVLGRAYAEVAHTVLDSKPPDNQVEDYVPRLRAAAQGAFKELRRIAEHASAKTECRQKIARCRLLLSASSVAEYSLSMSLRRRFQTESFTPLVSVLIQEEGRHASAAVRDEVQSSRR